VGLSVTESELGILKSMGLCVKKPMILYLDNKGAKDLANNWSVRGRTRHVEVCE
jgi:hypothetical protein